MTVSIDGWGGARTMVFLGLVGIRTRSALDTLEWIDETQLMSSVIPLCLIFLLP